MTHTIWDSLMIIEYGNHVCKNKFYIAEGVVMKREPLGRRVVLYASVPHQKRFVFFSHTIHIFTLELSHKESLECIINLYKDSVIG